MRCDSIIDSGANASSRNQREQANRCYRRQLNQPAQNGINAMTGTNTGVNTNVGARTGINAGAQTGISNQTGGITGGAAGAWWLKRQLDRDYTDWDKCPDWREYHGEHKRRSTHCRRLERLPVSILFGPNSPRCQFEAQCLITALSAQISRLWGNPPRRYHRPRSLQLRLRPRRNCSDPPLAAKSTRENVRTQRCFPRCRACAALLQPRSIPVDG